MQDIKACRCNVAPWIVECVDEICEMEMEE